MTGGDLFLVVVRWIHVVAAAAWVGGSIFYLFVLRPALRRSPEAGRKINEATAAEFATLVDTCIFVILATGVILTFNRLTAGVTGPSYGLVLAAKIALSVWMFILARGRRRRTALLDMYRQNPDPPSGRFRKILSALSGYNTIAILGVIVLLLADLLNTLYEVAIR
ncbi:MAG: hypothetical protein F4Y49_05490 [Dehalococcoidia bacterium]|nr:hypothetical protein [Dehalococcoidia bacterium]